MCDQRFSKYTPRIHHFQAKKQTNKPKQNKKKKKKKKKKKHLDKNVPLIATKFYPL